MRETINDLTTLIQRAFRALEMENELILEEKRKVELHSANIRAIYEQKVAELEAETKQSKEQLRTGFAEKKSLLDQVRFRQKVGKY